MYTTRTKVFDFRGAFSPPAVGSRQGRWCSKATGSCTIASASGGPIVLTLDATSEVQNACLYMGDILPYDIEELIRVTFLVKASASLPAAVSAAFGVCSARNDTLDTIAEQAMFTLKGSNALLCESDDGTTDNDDIATGFNLSTTYRRCAIDFSTGILTRSPPLKSLGGRAQTTFHVSNDRGALQRVAAGTNFNLSAYAGNLQLFAQLQKTTGTATGSLSILEIEVEHKIAG